MYSLRKRIDAMCKGCIYDPLAAGTWRQQTSLCRATSCPLWNVRPTSYRAIPEAVFDYYGVPKDERELFTKGSPGDRENWTRRMQRNGPDLAPGEESQGSGRAAEDRSEIHPNRADLDAQNADSEEVPA